MWYVSCYYVFTLPKQVFLAILDKEERIRVLWPGTAVYVYNKTCHPYFLLNSTSYCNLYCVQESYVWEMYLQHDWDFFPVGDCFHAQEERSGAVGVAGAGLTHPQRRQGLSSPSQLSFSNPRTN